MRISLRLFAGVRANSFSVGKVTLLESMSPLFPGVRANSFSIGKVIYDRQSRCIFFDILIFHLTTR